MTVVFGRAGGLVVDTKRFHFCIFPANTWFAAKKRVLVAFRIGFSLTIN